MNIVEWIKLEEWGNEREDQEILNKEVKDKKKGKKRKI